ncbi:MAG: 2,3-bisphosphoglycerate-dependent phosphoglycerate mutase [Gammaproteobacteria bacterium]
MSFLVLVRHGQSEWNAKNLFTGWKDPDLTKLGVEEANKAGTFIKKLGIVFDAMFTSDLVRAQKTGSIILQEINQDPPVIKNMALNERNYGDLAGLNKDDARKRWGEEQVHIWRRSFDISPPGGESLKNTAERVLPYFNEMIMPEILKNKNILIAAHGNSLRALVMKLDNLSADQVIALEIPTGAPIVYEINRTGEIVSKKTSF